MFILSHFHLFQILVSKMFPYKSITLNHSLSNWIISSQRLVTMSVSLRTQTVLPCLIIQVLNTRVWFLNDSLTSVRSNLERGLAKLTESFSPLRSVLHNLSCWSPKQKCILSHMIPFYITCIKPDQTSSHWPQLVPTNQSDWCKALTALLEISTTSQLTIDVVYR